MGLCGCRSCREAEAVERAQTAERIKAEDFAAKMDRLRKRFPRPIPEGDDAEYATLFQQPSMDTRASEIGGALRGVCGRCPGVPAHPHHDKPATT